VLATSRSRRARTVTVVAAGGVVMAGACEARAARAAGALGAAVVQVASGAAVVQAAAAAPSAVTRAVVVAEVDAGAATLPAGAAPVCGALRVRFRVRAGGAGAREARFCGYLPRDQVATRAARVPVGGQRQRRVRGRRC
jgi:hypothetical protein